MKKEYIDAEQFIEIENNNMILKIDIYNDGFKFIVIDYLTLYESEFISMKKINDITFENIDIIKKIIKYAIDKNKYSIEKYNENILHIIINYDIEPLNFIKNICLTKNTLTDIQKLNILTKIIEKMHIQYPTFGKHSSKEIEISYDNTIIQKINNTAYFNCQVNIIENINSEDIKYNSFTLKVINSEENKILAGITYDFDFTSNDTFINPDLSLSINGYAYSCVGYILQKYDKYIDNIIDANESSYITVHINHVKKILTFYVNKFLVWKINIDISKKWQFFIGLHSINDCVELVS